MNKVYTIGRDTSCDIVIQDSTDVVSRVHASLKAKGNGKYALIDQSRNGTYVNGIKMSANEEIPVTRKDIISFAHVKDLDWDLIPKAKHSKMIWLIVTLALVILSCLCYFLFIPKDEPLQPVAVEQEVQSEPYETPVDKDITTKDTIYIKQKPVVKSTPKKEKAEEKKEEKTVKDEPEVVNPLL